MAATATSKPSLYHYFSSKDALITAVVEYCAEKMLAASFDERLYPGFTLLANAFGKTEAEREELRQVVWLVVYSLGLAFLEQRALFGAKTLPQELLERAEWVVGAAERLLR